MTTDEIRIAMAELEGFEDPNCDIMDIQIGPDKKPWSSIPDYPGDLNAVRRVEAKFVHDPDWCRLYQYELINASVASTLPSWHADAITRCRAILKIEGKWKESP